MALQRFLVGTDGSEPATRAVEWAGSLAKQLDAALIAVQVFSSTWCSRLGAFSSYPKVKWERAKEKVALCWLENGPLRFGRLSRNIAR